MIFSKLEIVQFRELIDTIKTHLDILAEFQKGENVFERETATNAATAATNGAATTVGRVCF